jgi:hypothetical protein
MVSENRLRPLPAAQADPVQLFASSATIAVGIRQNLPAAQMVDATVLFLVARFVDALSVSLQTSSVAEVLAPRSKPAA